VDVCPTVIAALGTEGLTRYCIVNTRLFTAWIKASKFGTLSHFHSVIVFADNVEHIMDLYSKHFQIILEAGESV